MLNFRSLLPVVIAALSTITLLTFSGKSSDAASDLPPITLYKEVWVAQLSTAGPGVESFSIEYLSRDRWNVTTLSHSARPGIAGTRWSFDHGTTVFYDALRGVTRTYAGPNSPDHYLAPGLADSLSRLPGWVADRSDAKSVQLSLREVVGVNTRETAVHVDELGLPTLVEVRAQGQLVLRATYTRR
jgi:hypothetical protein